MSSDPSARSPSRTAMPRAALGLVVLGLIVAVVWLSGGKPKPPDGPAVSVPPVWEKVHDGGTFTVHRANTTPAAYLIAVGVHGLLIDCPVKLPDTFPAAVLSVLLTHHHRDGSEGAAAFGIVGAHKPAAESGGSRS